MGRERTFQREEMLKREGQRAAVIMASVGHDITSLAPVNVLKDTQAVTVVRVCVWGGGSVQSEAVPCSVQPPYTFLHHQLNYKHRSPCRWNYLLP